MSCISSPSLMQYILDSIHKKPSPGWLAPEIVAVKIHSHLNLFPIQGEGVKPSLALWLSAAIFLILAASSAGIFFITHSYYLFTILSGSMEPTIHTGAVAAVIKHQPDAYHIGDIVTFQSSRGIITHRIAKIIQTGE